MADKPKTKVDAHLEKLKNNRIIAVIVVGAMIVLAIVVFISEFTDSFSKIKDFASGFTDHELSIEYSVKNTTNDSVEIDRFSNFHITLPNSYFSAYSAPSGRLLLKPVGNNNTSSNYEIEPNQTKRYIAEFPKFADYEDLLIRGGMDIHFVIEPVKPQNYGSVLVITVPFHSEVINNLSLGYTIDKVVSTVTIDPSATRVHPTVITTPTQIPTASLTSTLIPMNTLVPAPVVFEARVSDINDDVEERVFSGEMKPKSGDLESGQSHLLCQVETIS